MKRPACERVQIKCKSGYRMILVERNQVKGRLKPIRAPQTAKSIPLASLLAKEVSSMLSGCPMRFPIILYGGLK